jgi:predicted MPP superfamily phosphohydrolase
MPKPSLLLVPAVILAFATGGQSRPNPKAEAVKVQEAAVLKDAYVLMAMSNHDYDGLRVKAMAQVEEAIKKLDHSVLKDGTKGQKVVATEEEIATARTAFEERHKGKVHETQGLSDAQMREAREILIKVHELLPAKKHAKASEHVGNALKHVDTALKIR